MWHMFPQCTQVLGFTCEWHVFPDLTSTAPCLLHFHLYLDVSPCGHSGQSCTASLLLAWHLFAATTHSCLPLLPCDPARSMRADARVVFPLGLIPQHNAWSVLCKHSALRNVSLLQLVSLWFYCQLHWPAVDSGLCNICHKAKLLWCEKHVWVGTG